MNQLMSQEEKVHLMMLTTELRKQGKEQEAFALELTIPLAPHLAMAAKEVYGTDYIKNAGFNLVEAYAEYGKDWLNK